MCINQDLNRNGIVDATENVNGSVDSNGQPTLEPRKSDLLVSFDNPTVTSTDANGIVIIKVQYSQRFATWLAYKLRVTAQRVRLARHGRASVRDRLPAGGFRERLVPHPAVRCAQLLLAGLMSKVEE